MFTFVQTISLLLPKACLYLHPNIVLNFVQTMSLPLSKVFIQTLSLPLTRHWPDIAFTLSRQCLYICPDPIFVQTLSVPLSLFHISSAQHMEQAELLDLHYTQQPSTRLPTSLNVFHKIFTRQQLPTLPITSCIVYNKKYHLEPRANLQCILRHNPKGIVHASQMLYEYFKNSMILKHQFFLYLL